MPSNNRPPLIPRDVLFDNPDKASARISPDGSRISYLAPVDGVLNVWIGPTNDLAAAKPVTNDTGRGIRSYSWAYTNQHILYSQDKGGDENWRIYKVDLESGETQDLTPFDNVQARIDRISHQHPDEILISINNREPQFHDIYRVRLSDGESELLLENEGYAGFVTDHDYNVRLAIGFTPDGGGQMLKRLDDEWELFFPISGEDILTTSPIGVNQSNDGVYMIDSRGRDTAALTELTFEGGTSKLLAEDAKADVSDTIVHPTKKTMQAVAFTHERKKWLILDETIAGDLAFLETVADGEVELIDRTLDDQAWIVGYTMDNGPVRYYLYDRAGQNATFLFTNRAALEGQPLAKMHSAVIPARDGLELVSYYTLPSWYDAPIPDEPLPMVLFVHGGPWARDNWGYNPVHQLLSNRGYAVLSVNFRSSTGLGKAFGNAGNLEWGAKMHDDLLDAVDWAVAEGIADRNRVAIMGGSYGGYATLAGLTLTPDVFACGVDIVGPSNLNTLIDSVPEYWKPQLDIMYTRVGNPTTEEGRALLHERSPLTHADKIVKPLLIAQGANDPRVKQAESDQIVDAMQVKGIPVTYVLYPDEGHGFARPENNLSFMAVAEAFLAKHMEEERYQPVGDGFAGSSITVPAGAADVPGLEDALG